VGNGAGGGVKSVVTGRAALSAADLGESLPLVSVVTANRDGLPYLPEAIASVRGQTYPAWELIVVVDASKDGSREFVSSLMREDSRIRLITREKASGSPALPRNQGIGESRGRFIAFLDSDDIWLPGKLETQVALFLSSPPETAIVFSDYEKISEKGERKRRRVKGPRELSYASLLKSNAIGCLTAMYDKEKIGKRYFPSLFHEDYLLWLDILRPGYTARNTGGVEALYRVREGSVSFRKRRTMKWQWDIYRKKLCLPLSRSLYYYFCYLTRGLSKYVT
jgi:glycosyltransferase involved in cell wall biosynthesis